MTTEQILQECKEVYATNYGFKSYADFQHRLSIGSSNANDFQDAIELLSTQLYAQKIAELFAEFLRSNNYQSNGGSFWRKTIPKQIGIKKEYKYETTSKLYTEFLNQLNKQK